MARLTDGRGAAVARQWIVGPTYVRADADDDALALAVLCASDDWLADTLAISAL